MAEVGIEKGAHGTTVAVALGDVLAVRLPENPTTGYVWTIESANALLELLESAYRVEGDAVGAGGTRTFRFRAVQAGAGDVHLRLARAWETTAVDAFRVRVAVT